MLPVLFYEKGCATRARRALFVGFLPFWSTCMLQSFLALQWLSMQQTSSSPFHVFSRREQGESHTGVLVCSSYRNHVYRNYTNNFDWWSNLSSITYTVQACKMKPMLQSIWCTACNLAGWSFIQVTVFTVFTCMRRGAKKSQVWRKTKGNERLLKLWWYHPHQVS